MKFHEIPRDEISDFDFSTPISTILRRRACNDRCGSRRTNGQQRLGHELVLGLGSGHDACSTPGTVGVGGCRWRHGGLVEPNHVAWGVTTTEEKATTFVSDTVSALYPDLGWKHCITVYPHRRRYAL